jgi:hypothetical protein
MREGFLSEVMCWKIMYVMEKNNDSKQAHKYIHTYIEGAFFTAQALSNANV